eukprot:TRINITY_DN2007_c0_g1_i2.p1 TRINITY_DN2007_c0_g1~~TRINITY_DN2007_c0_g1_i2.p1  ORF type:complete len:107 (+),score=13.08 TRINITY_DN2007_c0_g1_i2:319-639(+)
MSNLSVHLYHASEEFPREGRQGDKTGLLPGYQEHRTQARTKGGAELNGEPLNSKNGSTPKMAADAKVNRVGKRSRHLPEREGNMKLRSPEFRPVHSKLQSNVGDEG